jgi:hypothetical protein
MIVKRPKKMAIKTGTPIDIKKKMLPRVQPNRHNNSDKEKKQREHSKHHLHAEPFIFFSFIIHGYKIKL